MVSISKHVHASKVREFLHLSEPITCPPPSRNLIDIEGYKEQDPTYEILEKQ